MRRTAPGSSRGAAARRQARRAAPRRNPAPERRNAPAGPAPASPSPRAEPTVSERAALAGSRGSWEWTGPPERPAWAEPLANAATTAGKHGPSGGPGGDQAAKVTGPMRRGSAQVTGLINVGSAPGIRCPASSPSRGKVPDPNTHTAAQAAAVAVLPAVLAVRTVRISLHLCRSPSQDVRTSPPESRPVAVLSCCTVRPSMRPASFRWPGPDSSRTTPCRPAMTISSASAAPRTSGPTPAEKPRSVATSRTPRIRQTRPTSGAINAQRSAGSSRSGGMARGSPSARRISDGRPRGLPGHLRFGCWHRPDAPGSCGTSAARAAAGI